jgi:Flp pilus assembly protein TadG
MSKSKLLSRLRRFRNDTTGSMSIEFVLAMPVLFWAFAASFVFFDGYRQSAVNLKAAYTISDLISRETDAINNTYMDSMKNVLNLLVRPSSVTALRVTVVRWDAADNRYYVDWSSDRGFGAV